MQEHGNRRQGRQGQLQQFVVIDAESGAEAIAAVIDDDVFRREPRRDVCGVWCAKGEEPATPAFVRYEKAF